MQAEFNFASSVVPTQISCVWVGGGVWLGVITGSTAMYA